MTSKIVDLYLGGLIFNKTKVEKIVSDKSVTCLSWIAILIYMLLEPIFSLISGKPAGHSAFVRYTNLTGFWLFFAVFISTFIATVGFAIILLVFFKLFEVTGVLIRRLLKNQRKRVKKKLMKQC
ncbi:MAG: hypothetical protein K9W46_14095 [Candidatus Heimdallarchaeum endolithica]|uniref:Uncharacterized protein n=1 Tax=Candidatus Heimdallarchaeum endolithica TaxID=2876572 RepID=A0A9Y1BQP3_9ARCH|nr:MAG: hypothetical protein K9W46_14095 [Candidatus Heimdallarchaeum endolithica]